MQWHYISPLFGAVIGYTTNWIAIKMLFRPLNEKRIFGIRVPFTPGVIPRERHRIAVSIGNIVGNYLLTEEQITRTLLERKTEVGLRRFLRLKIHQILNNSLSIKEAITEINGIDEELISQFSLKLSTQVCSIITAKNTRDNITQYLQTLINEFLTSSIEEIINDHKLTKYSDLVNYNLNNFLAQEQVVERIKEFIDYKLKSLLDNDESIGKYIPMSIILELEKYLSLQGPEIIKLLRKYLQSPEIKLIIIRRLENFFESHLGNKLLGLIANLFKKRSEKLAEIIFETINNFLLDENLQKELLRFLQELLRSMFNTKINTIAKKLNLDDRDKRQEWVNWIHQQLTEKNKIESFISYLEAYLKDHKHYSWKELIGDFFIKEENINGFINHLVSTTLTRPGLQMLVTNTIQSKIKSVINKKICELTGNVQNKFIFQFTELIVFNAQLLIPKYTPVFLKTINIKDIVQRSVNSLDVSQIENVLLGVTKKELSYITWFGGLLGFLIGALQAVIG